MAAKNEETAPQPEEAGQKPGRKKLILWGLGLAALVVLSIGLTVLVFSGLQPEAPPAAAMPTMPVQVVDTAEVTALKAQLEQQAEAIARLEAQILDLQQSSARRQLNQTLVEQERSFQLFLAAMKEGMADMANMVRGSRTWLEHYEGRLDEVMAQSRTRAAALSESAGNSAAAPGGKP